MDSQNNNRTLAQHFAVMTHRPTPLQQNDNDQIIQRPKFSAQSAPINASDAFDPRQLTLMTYPTPVQPSRPSSGRQAISTIPNGHVKNFDF